MTLKEQLLREIEQAPDSLIEELLSLCRQIKSTSSNSTDDDIEQRLADKVAAQRKAIRLLQEKVRETVPEGRSLVDELIAERQMEVENE
jgi:hypothetical protein